MAANEYLREGVASIRGATDEELGETEEHSVRTEELRREIDGDMAKN